MKELYCYYDEVFKDYLSDGVFLHKYHTHFYYANKGV